MAWNVVLVDDEQVMHRYIAQMALWHGDTYRLAMQAYSADEVLAHLATNCVDVLLMDVSMPGKDGVQLSEEIRRQYPDVAIIAVSNYDQYEYVRQIMRNGASDYLLKSTLDEASLEAALSRAVRREDMPEQSKQPILRRRIKRWLETGEACPFTIDGSRLSICHVVVPGLQRMKKDAGTAAREGVIRLLESGDCADIAQTAVCLGEESFVVFFRFYNETSSARIQSAMEQVRLRWQDRVEEVYHLSIDAQLYPMMRSNDMLLDFVRHIVDMRAPETAVEKDSLTLSEQKTLLALIDRRDGEGVASCITEVFAQLPPKQLQGRMLLIRELMEMLRQAAREWQVEVTLPVGGAQLYQWIQAQHDPVASLAALYMQVLSQSPGNPAPSYSEPVRNAIRMMEKCYAQPISLCDMARSVNVTSSYLSRLFHRETGATPVEYLTRLRIEHGKRLLEDGASLKQTAAETGFPQYTYFLKVFRDVTGLTPTAYLQQVKNS